MALDYDKAIGFTKTGQTARITHTGAALYALSLGFGEDPMDQRELGFVLESRGPKTVPTMATVLAKGVVRDLDIDLRGVLHAEQRLRVLAPLPAQAELLMDTRVTSIIDKGPEAGAVVSYDIAGRDASDGRELFVLGYTLLARRDGGCGGPSGPAPQRRALPDRAPDAPSVSRPRPIRPCSIA